jgi:hypothetical protein
MTTPAATVLEEALGLLIEDSELFGANGLLPCRLEPGAPGSRVVLATGPNACGKSFVCRFLNMAVAGVREERGLTAKGEFFHIGMRMRTSGNGILGPKTFVYGDEGDQSTGATSLRAVNGMLRQSPGRDSDHVIALDEPDVGLSDEYAMAMGDKLRAFAAALPARCDALVVVSHSRAMVSRLMELRPHRLRFGPLSTEEWLASPPRPASVEELDGLADRNLETWRAITALMKARRADEH